MNDIEFGKRLKEAFGNKKQADIAKLLKVTDAGAKNYLEGRIPDAEVLFNVLDLTQCSLHWLLTGEGPKERQVVKAIKDGHVDINQLKDEAVQEFLVEAIQGLKKRKSKEVKKAG